MNIVQLTASSGRAALRRDLRAHMMALRDQARRKHGHLSPPELRQAIFLDPRTGHLNGDCVERLVFFLRGTGCAWVSRAGGCTFCGFWDATNFGQKVNDAQYIDQLDGALAQLGSDVGRYPILCVYNDGSLLDETEASSEAVSAIVRRLVAIPTARRIVIESKVTDLNRDNLSKLRVAAGSCELEIAVGFESANSDIRDLCVNKDFAARRFAAAATLMRSLDVRLVPLVMVKPPFLTEAQAVADVVATLQYLEPFGLPRVDLELATVEEHTLVQDLWTQGLYRPPRLWSVIEIVRRSHAMGLRTPVFISPPNYTVPSLAYTTNCSVCTPGVVKAIETYNEKFDITVFNSVDCDCRAEWRRELEGPDEICDLEAQVRGVFDRLRDLQFARPVERHT